VQAIPPRAPAQQPFRLIRLTCSLTDRSVAYSPRRLDDSLSPLIVLFANSRPPMQLTPSLLSKGLATALFPSARQQAAALSVLVAQRSEPKLWPVTKTEQLREICVERGRLCALILHHGDLKQDQARALRPLLAEFRAVHFLTLNMARYDFSLSRKLPEVTRDTPRLLAMRSAAVAGNKSDRSRSLGARAHKEEFAAASLRDFVSSHVEGTLELTSLRKPPEIAWRKQKAGGGKGDKAGSKGGSKWGKGGSPRGGTASAADAETPDYRQGQAERRRRHEAGVRSKQHAARRGGRWGRSAGGASTPGRGSKAGGAAEADEGQREAELRRRQQMAEEEAEYLRGMFAEEEEEEEEQEEGLLGESEWGEEEELLDLDDAEEEEEQGEEEAYAGGTERAGGGATDESGVLEEEGKEEGWGAEGGGLVREAVAVDGSFEGA
jgi:hypothetical protein